MRRKLLILTVGTVAARVGRKILKQVEAHPASELNLTVRYIDTAYLPGREPDIREHEWFHLRIDPHFLQLSLRNREINPQLEKMLYPGCLPETSGAGSRGTRYNAAGAVVLNQSGLRDWLSNNISELVRSNDPNVSISVALIVSSVGATSSGSLERLIDIIDDSARYSNLPQPTRCDTFVLQPARQGVDNRGLANAFALYAEMAASRLMNTYQGYHLGRTIMIGWGSRYSLSSVEQLQEAAATLVRVSNDPVSDIAVEFQEREVDNHVLREINSLTQLPMHLSSATAITITLGNLEEQVIQRDAVRLADRLVFGSTTSFTNTDDLFIGTLADFLGGNTPRTCYHHLLSSMLKSVRLESLDMTVEAMKAFPAKQLASRLEVIWQADMSRIKESQSHMATQVGALVKDTIDRLARERVSCLNSGLALQQLANAYQALQQTLKAILTEAYEDEGSVVPDDKATSMALDALSRSTLFDRRDLLKHALQAVQATTQAYLKKHSNPHAIAVVEELISHCGQSISWLDTILEQWQLEHQSHQEWAIDHPLNAHAKHPLQLLALRSERETRAYTELLSIFTPRIQDEGRMYLTNMVEDDVLEKFRNWLLDRVAIDALLEANNFDRLLGLAQIFTRKHFERRPVLEVLQQVSTKIGENVLQRRLAEAYERCFSPVNYHPGFANDCREFRHVTAFYRDDEQRAFILEAMDQKTGRTTLLKSEDPTEICVFYYVDGLSMSAVSDLSGRCFRAFHEEYQSRLGKGLLSSSKSRNIGENNEDTTYFKVPIFSGSDTEQRVRESGILDRLYDSRPPDGSQEFYNPLGETALGRKRSP